MNPNMKSTLRLTPSLLEQHLWSISLQVSAKENTKQIACYHFQFKFVSAPEFVDYKICDRQSSKGNCPVITNNVYPVIIVT